MQLSTVIDGNIKFSQRKLFAPARYYLAYVPNNRGGEVAATEGRTVFHFFSYKRL
jgi:hypothetical protein